MEKIIVFLVWYNSLKLWCLNYMKNSCKIEYLIKNIRYNVRYFKYVVVCVYL